MKLLLVLLICNLVVVAQSDDPNELAAELSALAGPAAGPSGAQVFVDGFTAGPTLPDKQSIREIVINQNPFSAEWERIGFGNIQILTRPGTGQFHGNAALTFSDAAFHARNPFASNRPAYQRRIYDAGINGPLAKLSSFFLSFTRMEIDDTAVINATALGPGLIVLDAFSGGGSQIGRYVFDRNEGELRDYLTMSLGRHSLKFGARLRRWRWRVSVNDRWRPCVCGSASMGRVARSFRVTSVMAKVTFP